MPRLSTLTTLAAAVFVAAAATLAFPVAPAQAAYCSGGAGVSVLVDYGALGGGTATGCGGDASVASDAFGKAGFTLSRHPQQPGFVCRVAGKPDTNNCMGTNSYWGFFVSDDDKGWVYASQGVYQQAVDSGDKVALVWQSCAAMRNPGAPVVPCDGGDEESVPPSGKTTKRPKPKPTTSPAKPTPTAAATTEAVTPSPTATRSASAPTKPKRTAPASPAATSSIATPTAETTPTETTTPSPSVNAATEPASSEDGGGLPGWVAPAVIALLALAAGGVAWARRVR